MLLDAAETFWSDWVLNYSLDRQLNLAASAEMSADRFRLKALSFSISELRRPIRAAFERVKPWLGPAAALVVVVGLLIWQVPILWKLWTHRSHLVRVRSGRISQSDAAVLYNRMLKALHARGFEKPAWLTPREFSAVITDKTSAEPVRRLTEAYYELRYKGTPSAAGVMLSALEELENPR